MPKAPQQVEYCELYAYMKTLVGPVPPVMPVIELPSYNSVGYGVAMIGRPLFGSMMTVGAQA
jgi:hypothetical protein